MTSILVVDDHAIFAQALRRVLTEKSPWNVAGVATSVEEALSQLAALQVDLVLVDVSLQTTSGITLVGMLREMYPDLPCIMLSGHLSQHYARRSLEAGARGYLIKDRTDELLTGIERVLQGEIYVSEQLR